MKINREIDKKIIEDIQLQEIILNDTDIYLYQKSIFSGLDLKKYLNNKFEESMILELYFTFIISEYIKVEVDNIENISKNFDELRNQIIDFVCNRINNIKNKFFDEILNNIEKELNIKFNKNSSIYKSFINGFINAISDYDTQLKIILHLIDAKLEMYSIEKIENDKYLIETNKGFMVGYKEGNQFYLEDVKENYNDNE